MRSSSQRFASACKTGKREAARVSPALRRRVGSSRPRLCGIETTRGADIVRSSSTSLDVVPHFPKKRARSATAIERNFQSSELFFRRMAAQQVATAGLEETIDVYWNDYLDHSHYCFAGWLQWHWR